MEEEGERGKKIRKKKSLVRRDNSAKPCRLVGPATTRSNNRKREKGCVFSLVVFEFQRKISRPFLTYIPWKYIFRKEIIITTVTRENNTLRDRYIMRLLLLCYTSVLGFY